MLAVVLIAAAVLGVALSLTGQRPAGDSTVASQVARAQAAAWIAAQVSHDVTVSCDPAMCAVLRARGFPPEELRVLGPGASGRPDSGLVAVTGVLRSRFGSPLTAVYAPLTIASFGTGQALVEVRVVAPHGAPAYLSQFRADIAARSRAGGQLLRNPQVAVAAAAGRQLSSGRVDSRLVMAIATMAALHPVHIVSFGDAGPAADPGVPLRSAVLGAATGGPAGLAVLSSLRTFLRAQQPPYQPAAIDVRRDSADQSVLFVQFDAPSPLGLLSTASPVVKIG